MSVRHRFFDGTRLAGRQRSISSGRGALTPLRPAGVDAMYGIAHTIQLDCAIIRG
jgi:hypothetical protein